MNLSQRENLPPVPITIIVKESTGNNGDHKSCPKIMSSGVACIHPLHSLKVITRDARVHGTVVRWFLSEVQVTIDQFTHNIWKHNQIDRVDKIQKREINLLGQTSHADSRSLAELANLLVEGYSDVSDSKTPALQSNSSKNPAHQSHQPTHDKKNMQAKIVIAALIVMVCLLAPAMTVQAEKSSVVGCEICEWLIATAEGVGWIFASS